MSTRIAGQCEKIVDSLTLVIARLNDLKEGLKELSSMLTAEAREEVPSSRDSRLSSSPTSRAPRQSLVIPGTCAKGHPQTEENLYRYPKGDRTECRVCKVKKDHDYKEKKKLERTSQTSPLR